MVKLTNTPHNNRTENHYCITFLGISLEDYHTVGPLDRRQTMIHASPAHHHHTDATLRDVTRRPALDRLCHNIVSDEDSYIDLYPSRLTEKRYYCLTQISIVCCVVCRAAPRTSF